MSSQYPIIFRNEQTTLSNNILVGVWKIKKMN